MNMFRANSLETLTISKANPALHHVPAVMISTAADPAQVAIAYKQGISGYIQKLITNVHTDLIAQTTKTCLFKRYLDIEDGIADPIRLI